MMTSSELSNVLGRLKLTQSEASKLLGVSLRTMHRWIAGEQVPGPVEQALLAWSKLETLRLAWRPDSVSVFNDDKEQIDLIRAHAVELAALISRVESRGGPRIPWSVSLDKWEAELGPMVVGFHPLQNGGFSLGTYRRRDMPSPDVKRDWEFIEDAAYCIAMAMRDHKIAE